MKHISRSKSAISNGIFGAAVVVFIVVAAIGYGLYGTAASKPAVTSTLTVATTNVSTEMITSETAMMNHTSMTEMSRNSSSGCACTFTPKSGAMISSAWFVSAPSEMANQFAVSVHAEGLEPNGTYIVEGTLMTGSMTAVPISSQAMHANTTSASEFQADKNGTGNYFILLDSNPMTTFENVELLYLPGMVMQNETLVATLSMSSMMTSTTMMETSMMTTSTTG
jgi:hypothetical protein